MRICWKSFFLAFSVAVLLFSILMIGICVGVFNKFIPSAMQDSMVGQTVDFAEERTYESYIFYCNDKEDQVLDFAIFVRIDEKAKQILVTELNGEDLLERQGMLFYIHSLCQTYGTKELLPIFAALTGYAVPTERLLNVRDYMPQSEKGATVRYLDFLELLPSTIGQADSFSIVECPLVTEVSGEFKILNIQRSLEVFLPLK